MSAACPFCGDDREPTVEYVSPSPSRGNRLFAWCPSCYARGPLSATEAGALTLWQNREAPGSSEPWRIQFEKIL